MDELQENIVSIVREQLNKRGQPMDSGSRYYCFYVESFCSAWVVNCYLPQIYFYINLLSYFFPSRNLLKFLITVSGIGEVRSLAMQKLEIWLQVSRSAGGGCLVD